MPVCRLARFSQMQSRPRARVAFTRSSISLTPLSLQTTQAYDSTGNMLLLLTGPDKAATRFMQLPLLPLAAGLLWFVTSSPQAARAGEWIVETHSLTVRSPASLAGTEDAAIGDVSNFCTSDATQMLSVFPTYSLMPSPSMD